MTVVERNWRCPAGEIDIVALDGDDARAVRGQDAADARRRARPRRPSRRRSSDGTRGSPRRTCRRPGVEPVDVRFDVITLLVIAEDRALLRHHRAAFVPE